MLEKAAVIPAASVLSHTANVSCSKAGSKHAVLLCLQYRFSTFLWVQALDLAILAARSGALCALPEGVFRSTQSCMLVVLGSHAIITYILAGGTVWYMDMQARCTFVQRSQPTVQVAT